MPKTDQYEDLPALAMPVAEIAARARLSRSMVYKQVRLGRLKLRKIGAKSFALPSDVDRFLRGLPMATD